MLVFDPTEETTAAVWHDYAAGVRVKVNPMRRDVHRRIVKKAKRIHKQTRESIDDCIDRLVYEYMVEDWDGIVDPDGNPIPATKDMVAAVTAQLNDFADWLVETAADLAESQAAARADQLKKFNASQDGSKTVPAVCPDATERVTPATS